jgi:sec-independent protein translocase protein TatA
MESTVLGIVPGLFGHFGIQEIVLILAIVLLLFGASRIPEIARSLGKGVDEFKKGLKGEDGGSSPPPPVPPPSDPKQIEDKKD